MNIDQIKKIKLFRDEPPIMGHLSPYLWNNSIIFQGDTQGEAMKLEHGWFWYRGEKIKDINKVYERFNDLLAGLRSTGNY